jgi:hypothetical protein
MRRMVLGAVLLVGLTTACVNPLGRGVPECDTSQLTSSMVIQVQSVPSAAYVSCIYGLKTGWTYEDLDARSGRSVFRLDSDRMGLRFLTVEALPSCEPTGLPTALADDDYPGVELFKDIESESSVDVVIVPEGPAGATVSRALEISAELEDTQIKDRDVNVSISSGDDPTRQRIDAAAANGAHVIAISIRDAEEGTLSVRLAGTSAAEELSVNGLGSAVDRITAVETPPIYRGKWYFVFDGGCVVYTFNARGPGVSTLEDDVNLVLGLFDAEALRRVARDEGFDL